MFSVGTFRVTHYVLKNMMYTLAITCPIPKFCDSATCVLFTTDPLFC